MPAYIPKPIAASKPGLDFVTKRVIRSYLRYKLSQAERAVHRLTLAAETDPTPFSRQNRAYWDNVCSAIRWLAVGLGMDILE